MSRLCLSLVFVALLLVQANADCYAHGGDCNACFADPSSICGFCGVAGFGGFCGEGGVLGSTFRLNGYTKECPREIWYFPGRTNLDRCLSSRASLGNGTGSVATIPFLIAGFGGWLDSTLSANFTVSTPTSGENRTVSGAARVVLRAMYYDESYVTGIIKKNWMSLSRLVLYGAMTGNIYPTPWFITLQTGLGVVQYDSITIVAMAEFIDNGESLNCAPNSILEECQPLLTTSQVRAPSGPFSSVSITRTVDIRNGETTVVMSGDYLDITCVHRRTDRPIGKEINPFQSDCRLDMKFPVMNASSNAIAIAFFAASSQFVIGQLPSTGSDIDPTLADLESQGTSFNNSNFLNTAFFSLPSYARIENGPFNSTVINRTVSLFVVPINKAKRSPSPVSASYTADSFAVLAQPSDDSLSKGAIAAIVTVAAVSVAVAGIVIWKCYHKLPTFMRAARTTDASWR